MQTPKISLVIPIYNVERFLPHTLESIALQTFADFEALCVIDGSKDRCADIVNNFAQKDKRFIAINKENGGVSSTRNLGLKKAKGNYIIFLDGDDYLHPQCLEITYKAMQETQADICQFAYQPVEEDKKVNFINQSSLQNIQIFTNPLQDLINGKFKKEGVVWNKIFKREIAQMAEFRALFPHEDSVYTFETMLLSKKYVIIDNILHFYVQNRHSVMHTMPKDNLDENIIKMHYFIIQAIEKYLQNHSSNNKLLQALLTKHQTAYYKTYYKQLIRKPLKRSSDIETLQQSYAKWCEITDNKNYNPKMLSYNRRIALWLLKHKYYKPARFIL